MSPRRGGRDGGSVRCGWPFRRGRWLARCRRGM